MSGAFLVRLAGITAHYRDPRYNTGGAGGNPPIGTLYCPPPCTMHGMLCAAKGGRVDPAGLVMGWRMDFDTVCGDFQTCRLPKKISPRLREFLVFPRLTIFVVSGAESAWFRHPINPLLFGRSEDLVTAKEIRNDIEWDTCAEAAIARQCLPIPLGSGPLYSAPLYFERNRVPVAMAPKIDSRVEQSIRIANSKHGHLFAQLKDTKEAFFLWDYSRVAG